MPDRPILRGRRRFAALQLTCLLLAGGSSSPVISLDPDHQLADVLAAIDRHADFYRDIALKFSCDETIEFAAPGRWDRTLNLEYIYVYDGDRLADYRTRRRGHGGKPADLIQPENHGLPFFLRRAYSWVFIFERAKRDMYRYQHMGEDSALGRDAIVISFEPIPPIREDLNDWVGRAWIDPGSHRILRIEALKSHDHDQKTAFETALRSTTEDRGIRKFTFTTITTQFTVEEKDILLPGEVTATRTLYSVFPVGAKIHFKEDPLFRVTQTYENYRFFGVETQDVFRAIIP